MTISTVKLLHLGEAKLSVLTGLAHLSSSVSVQ